MGLLIKPILFSFILFFTFSHPAFAIVNIESIRPDDGVKGFNNTLDMSANGSSGNSDVRSINAGLRVEYVDIDKTYLFSSNYAYGKSNGNINKDKGFLHGRITKVIHTTMAGEIFAQSQRNKFARLSSRNLIGVGGRFKLSNNKTTNLYLGTGLFYEQENLINSNVAEENDVTRLNLYFVANLRLNANLRIISTTYYQPTVDRFNDYRLLEQFSLLNKAGENLDLKLSMDLAHDSEPPNGVVKRESNYSAGFVYHF